MKYLLFNKPFGVLSQFTDEGTGHATLKDFINVLNVYAAGRLDRDSEGLLLLTDDGALIKKISDPAHRSEKTYFVMVEGEPTTEKLTQLENGIQLKGYRTRPCQARIIPDPSLPARPKPVTPHGPTAWLEIKLREGKKRQIRHMTAAVGLFTLRLVRAAIGPIELGDLESGKWRELTSAELRSLKQ
ncbi:MAG: pseudouridine synthase [Anaerolineales bacterium]|nr:pseudouridine synthase [Anaerolineales bacterium]